MKEKQMRPVMICTEKKGVFVGLCDDVNADPLVLYDAQMCISWSQSTRGVMGLASIGPQPGSKIGPILDSISHPKKDVTCIVAVKPKALELWRSEPWS